MSTSQQVQTGQHSSPQPNLAAAGILAQQGSAGAQTVQAIYSQIRQLAQSASPAGQHAKYVLTHKVPEVEFGKAVFESTLNLAAQSIVQGNNASNFRDEFIKSVENLAAEFNSNQGGKREIKINRTQSGYTVVMPNGYPPLQIGANDDRDTILQSVSTWYFSCFLSAQTKRPGQTHPDYLSDENIQRALADPNSLNVLMGLQTGNLRHGTISPVDRAAIDFARMGVRAEIQQRMADQRFEHRTELMELRHDQRTDLMELRHDQRTDLMELRHDQRLEAAEHQSKIRAKSQLAQFTLNQAERDAEAASRAYLAVANTGSRVAAKVAEKHWMPTREREVFVRGYDKNGNPRYGTYTKTREPSFGRIAQGAFIYAGGVLLADWAGQRFARSVINVRNEAVRRALGAGNEAIALFEEMYGPFKPE